MLASPCAGAAVSLCSCSPPHDRPRSPLLPSSGQPDDRRRSTSPAASSLVRDVVSTCVQLVDDGFSTRLVAELSGWG
ncbi:unnamed protein product [Linum trigynum]|uniref:Secreted protein n=1 Tax=Linum trigynum TaxID=586398 RepID=A0AAV2CVG1_9ROSI